MNRTIKMLLSAVAFFSCHAMAVHAQQERTLLDGLEYKVSAEASATHGDRTPLWLNANKYGLSSLEKYNGHVRAGVIRPLAVDSARKWGVGYGIDVAGAFRYKIGRAHV